MKVSTNLITGMRMEANYKFQKYMAESYNISSTNHTTRTLDYNDDEMTLVLYGVIHTWQ